MKKSIKYITVILFLLMTTLLLSSCCTTKQGCGTYTNYKLGN